MKRGHRQKSPKPRVHSLSPSATPSPVAVSTAARPQPSSAGAMHDQEEPSAPARILVEASALSASSVQFSKSGSAAPLRPSSAVKAAEMAPAASGQTEPAKQAAWEPPTGDKLVGQFLQVTADPLVQTDGLSAAILSSDQAAALHGEDAAAAPHPGTLTSVGKISLFASAELTNAASSAAHSLSHSAVPFMHEMPTLFSSHSAPKTPNDLGHVTRPPLNPLLHGKACEPFSNGCGSHAAQTPPPLGQNQQKGPTKILTTHAPHASPSSITNRPNEGPIAYNSSPTAQTAQKTNSTPKTHHIHKVAIHTQNHHKINPPYHTPQTPQTPPLQNLQLHFTHGLKKFGFLTPQPGSS